MGRPSSYSTEVADMICAEIAQGAALYKLCERDDMPDNATVYRWLEQHAEFRDKYARARDQQQDREVDHIVVIADEAEDANLARLRIDARKWRASKLAPKKYGDKVETVHSGELRVGRIERVIVRPDATDTNR